MHQELTIKAIGVGLATIGSAFPTLFAGGVLAAATDDFSLFGIPLSVFEKITLVTGLMLLTGGMAWIGKLLFNRYDTIQQERIKDAKDSSTASLDIIKANTAALQQVANSQEQLTEAVKELSRKINH
jgi:hypothetical protein